MDRLRLGFLILLAAPLAWIGAVLLLDPPGRSGYLAALAVVVAGAGLAAWAVPANRRILGPLGMGVAAFGMALFYDFDLFSDLANRAGGIVLLGLAVGAVGVALDTLRGLAAGLAVVACGGALWGYVDGATWEWQVGNVLLVTGAVLSAIPAWKRG